MAEKGALHLNAVTEDALLAKRLALYFRRERLIAVTSTPAPLPEDETDAYFVPLARVGELLANPGRPATWLPVLAHGAPDQLRAAFLAGCSDFLREPWTLEELAIRVRRVARGPGFRLPCGELRLSVSSASIGSRRIELSLQEYRLLRALLAQRGTVVPRGTLYYALWGREGADSRAVDVHVSSIRRKLCLLGAGAGRERVIRSVRGAGYLLVSAEDA